MQLTTDFVLQWVGFAGVVLANYYYVSRPSIAAALAFIGSVALSSWCWMQEPFPVGVFLVQAVVAVISLNNLRRSEGWYDI